MPCIFRFMIRTNSFACSGSFAATGKTVLCAGLRSQFCRTLQSFPFRQARSIPEAANPAARRLCRFRPPATLKKV
jgi:hypothetical protein